LYAAGTRSTQDTRRFDDVVIDAGQLETAASPTGGSGPEPAEA
jgi:hypothetical protein